MKKVVLALVAIALLVPVGLAGVWIYGQAAQPAQAQTLPESDYKSSQIVTVVGEGTVRVQPDIAQVSIGVEILGDTVSKAVDDNEAQMKAILAALKAEGIADKDIQTSNFSISVERTSQPVAAVEGSTTDQGKAQYRVSNMVNVTVRDLAKVSDVLDSVISAGANNIWGVTFSVDEPKAAQEEARAKAMADAQARAEALAGLGKVSLGPIMSITEAVSGGVVPSYALADRAGGGSGPSISVGEVEISYQVQVSYYIQP